MAATRPDEDDNGTGLPIDFNAMKGAVVLDIDVNRRTANAFQSVHISHRIDTTQGEPL